MKKFITSAAISLLWKGVRNEAFNLKESKWNSDHGNVLTCTMIFGLFGGKLQVKLTFNLFL